MEDVTLGEVHRRVEELHGEVDDLRKSIVGKERLTDIITAYEVQMRLEFKALEARIDTLEQWQTWGVRIVLGIVIAAIVGLVVAAERG